MKLLRDKEYIGKIKSFYRFEILIFCHSEEPSRLVIPRNLLALSFRGTTVTRNLILQTIKSSLVAFDTYFKLKKLI